MDRACCDIFDPENPKKSHDCMFFAGSGAIGEGGDIWNRITFCLADNDLNKLKNLLESGLNPNMTRFFCGWSVPALASGFDCKNLDLKLLELLVAYGANPCHKVIPQSEWWSHLNREVPTEKNMIEWLDEEAIRDTYPSAKRIRDFLVTKGHGDSRETI